MIITSPKLTRGISNLKTEDGDGFVCLDPIEELFEIPKAASYWIRASSKKPRGRNYARVGFNWDHYEWRWKILGLNDMGCCVYDSVKEILDICYPNGGNHYLYFWILYQ